MQVRAACGSVRANSAYSENVRTPVSSAVARFIANE